MSVRVILSLVIVLVLCGVLAASLLSSQDLSVPLQNGQALLRRPGPLLRFRHNTTATIVHRVTSGVRGEVALLQSWLEGPVALLSTGSDDKVLCLYDFDTSQELLVIDFGTKGVGAPTLPEELKPIARAATHEVHLASQNELDQALSLVHAAGESESHVAVAGWGGLLRGDRTKRIVNSLEKVFPYLGDGVWGANKAGERRLR